MRSLQARMFLVFALIATLPVLAMSYLALTFTQVELRAEIGEANGDAAKAAASFAGVYVDNARVLMEAEARAPALRQGVASDDRDALVAAAAALRDRATYQGTTLFVGLAVFDPAGALLAVTPADATDAMGDEAHEQAAAFALARGSAHLAAVSAEAPPVLPIAVPVFDDGGRPVAILVGDLSFTGLKAGLDAFGPGVFLTDAEGRLILHDDADAVGSRADWSAVAPVRLARQEGSGYIEYDDPLTGERALGSFARLPRLNWVVVNTVPASVAFGALDKLTAVLVALSGLLVGAVLLASVAVARRIVAPVQDLTDASRALAEGNLGRRIAASGSDEIGELGRAFNQMADRIAVSLEGLRRSESRYRSLVESASDLIFTIQPDGALSFASPHMRRVLGSVPEGAASRIVHPDDRAAFEEAVRRVLDGREPALHVPFRLLAQSGEARAVLTNFTPIFDGADSPARVLAVAHDVTEARREQELREKAFHMARLVSEQATLDSLAREGLALMVSATQAARGALFLARGGALHPAASLGGGGELADVATTAFVQDAESYADVGEGRAVAIPLREHGDVVGVVVLAGAPGAFEGERAAVLAPLASQLAVGLRRSLFEQRLKEYASELETRVHERTRELTAKSDEMEQFLYSVSHDLKAPLISIQGYAQSLDEDYGTLLQGDGALYLDRIRKNASQMESLILDILELSRIGRIRERVEAVDVEKLFVDIAGRMAGRFGAVEGELVVQKPLPVVEAEPRRLAQLFTNLVDNALKYRHPDRPPRVRVWAEEDATRVVYHVQDNGRGIAPRHHDQLFKIFQRVPTPGMDDPGGTGMGLAIVQRIAQMQGGEVSLDSVEGEGTTFHVALPRRRA